MTPHSPLNGRSVNSVNSDNKEDILMKCNIGRTDRIIRVIIGLAIIWAGFYYENWWGAIGIVVLVPAAIGYSPLYVPFKFSTCRKDD
jgi:hypothetical protein